MTTLFPALPADMTQPAFMDEVAFSDLFHGAMEEMSAMHDREETTSAVKVDWMPSLVGPLLIGVHDRHVRFVLFGEAEQLHRQLIALQKQLRLPLRTGSHRVLEQCIEELDAYFAGDRDEFEVPRKALGTVFQQKVWAGLQQIPYARTWSYEELASHIGQPTAARAVGLANGANPLAILIPCHRVIQKNGNLGGYGGGLWRKQRLMGLEQQHSL